MRKVKVYNFTLRKTPTRHIKKSKVECAIIKVLFLGFKCKSVDNTREKVRKRTFRT